EPEPETETEPEPEPEMQGARPAKRAPPAGWPAWSRPRARAPPATARQDRSRSAAASPGLGPSPAAGPRPPRAGRPAPPRADRAAVALRSRGPGPPGWSEDGP